MARYKLTGNYGTFEVSREVEAEDDFAAFAETGIMSVLQAAGWSIDGPEGEEWTVEVFEPVTGTWHLAGMIG